MKFESKLKRIRQIFIFLFLYYCHYITIYSLLRFLCWNGWICYENLVVTLIITIRNRWLRSIVFCLICVIICIWKSTFSIRICISVLLFVVIHYILQIATIFSYINSFLSFFFNSFGDKNLSTKIRERVRFELVELYIEKCFYLILYWKLL